jgi:hypothetical protein
VKRSAMRTEERKPSADAIARVNLFGTDQGGRKSAIPPMRYRCPVFFGEERGESNDCAFLFDRVGRALEPGGAAVIVPIKFLSRELVGDRLKPGARLVLWEAGDIGEAEILEVFPMAVP